MDDISYERLFQTIYFDKILSGLKNCPFSNIKDLGQLSLVESDGQPANRFIFILNRCIQNLESLGNFIWVLLHTGHDETVFLLYAKMDKLDELHFVDLSRFDPSTGSVKNFRVDKANPFDILEPPPRDRYPTRTPSYSMTSETRGYCILINNYFTSGTYKEMQRFRNIFFQLHFKVKMKKNMDKKDILNYLRVKSQDPQLAAHDAFVLMIIAHGNENREIYGSDYLPIGINTIMRMFNNKECSLLQGKPRLFFFNCCRGTMTDHGVTTLSANLPSVINFPLSVPTNHDTLVCFSTLDGYLAEVDWNEGTKFGQALADSFVEKASYKDVNGILITANSKLAQWTANTSTKQPIEWTKNMTKELFFNPKTPRIKMINSEI